MGFTLLDEIQLYSLILGLDAATVLYHQLGGDVNHTVIMVRKRWNSWTQDGQRREICSNEMLARDQYDMCHEIAIRFIDSLEDLHGIEEHPLAGVWEQETNGNVGFAKPRTRFVIYITDEPLPNGQMMCKIGFPMQRDEMHIKLELPSVIITTATNDSSSLGTFIQYLKRPEAGNTEYGALSARADLMRKYLYIV